MMPEPTTPIDELRMLSQIVRRTENLSDASKLWLRDRLNADLGLVLPHTPAQVELIEDDGSYA